MPNLIKPQYVVNHQSKTRLIDSNIKLEALRKEVEKKATIEEAAQAEFISGIDVQQISYIEPQQVIEDAQTTVDKMITDAKEQAERIIDEAQQEKEHLYEKAFQDGKRDGYQEGNLALQLEYDQKAEEWELRIQVIKEEYDEKQKEMEPLIVDTLLEVMDKVLEIQITDKREIVLALLRKSILHIENTNEFRVFLNRTQLDYLNENFQRFQMELGQGNTVNCFSDDTLTDEQCRIETDFGTYYCGFDIHYKNLIKEIKTLSI